MSNLSSFTPKYVGIIQNGKSLFLLCTFSSEYLARILTTLQPGCEVVDIFSDSISDSDSTYSKISDFNPDFDSKCINPTPEDLKNHLQPQQEKWLLGFMVRETRVQLLVVKVMMMTKN